MIMGVALGSLLFALSCPSSFGLPPRNPARSPWSTLRAALLRFPLRTALFALRSLNLRAAPSAFPLRLFGLLRFAPCSGSSLLQVAKVEVESAEDLANRFG